MKKLAVAIAVMALAVPATMGSAHARSLRGYCQDFAQIAVNQYQRNLQKRCGYSGSQWHGNYKAHYHWCMKAGAQRAQKVLNAHQSALARCSGGASKKLRIFCKEYARYSSKQGGKNQQYRCGYSGGGWHTNYNAHYNWCLRVGQGTAKRAMKERSKLLDRCKDGGFPRGGGGGYNPGGGGQPGGGGYNPGGGSPPPPPVYRGGLQGWCQSYSARAMGQVQRMYSMGCRYSGSLWANDGGYHYRRCMSIGQGGAQNEERTRSYMLTNCGRRY